jgi:hypothetical protein
VYSADLERAVQYALKTEVAAQAVLSSSELLALYQFLEVCVRFMPNLRNDTRNFLVALREWPVAMQLRSVANADYKDKVGT